MFGSRITGTGSAFPKTVVTNEDLVNQLGKKGIETNDEWIRERTGITERRISEAGNPEEYNHVLGSKASLLALEMARKKPEDIDQIIYATCTPDSLIPASACYLQKRIGATKAWATDINAACSGFVYGITIADQFIRTGHAKTILVVGGEVTSTFVDWEDRTSCILFGDGAGAAIIEQVAEDSPRKILSTHLKSDGNEWELFHMTAGGSNIEMTPEEIKKRTNKMSMKGKEIFKVATRTLSDLAILALETNGMTKEELNWFIPHQANIRIIDAVAKRLNFPKERVVVNIEKFGNTSAGTIITALDGAVRSGKIKEGDSILIDAFGAGLTSGSALLRW